MRLTALAPLLSVAIAAQAASAIAQSPRFSPDAEREFERMAAERLAEFGEPPIASYAEQGIEIIRAYNFWGRASRSMALFIRAPGKEPQLIVKYPGQPTPVGTATISEATIDRLFEAGRYFDHELVPPTIDPRAVVVCGDGSATMVETADLNGKIRRKLQFRDQPGTCGGGLARAYAGLLGEEAVAAIPACNALVASVGGGFRALDWCSLLEGDRVAAAHAMNRFRGASFRTFSGADRQPLFDPAIVSRIEGVPQAQGSEKVVQVWRALGPNGGYLEDDRFIGHSSERVTTLGTLHIYNAERTDLRAMPVRLEWLAAPNSDAFRVVLIEAGAKLGEPGAP